MNCEWYKKRFHLWKQDRWNYKNLTFEPAIYLSRKKTLSMPLDLAHNSTSKNILQVRRGHLWKRFSQKGTKWNKSESDILNSIRLLLWPVESLKIWFLNCFVELLHCYQHTQHLLEFLQILTHHESNLMFLIWIHQMVLKLPKSFFGNEFVPKDWMGDKWKQCHNYNIPSVDDQIYILNHTCKYRNYCRIHTQLDPLQKINDNKQ